MPVCAVELIEGNVFLQNGQEITVDGRTDLSVADAKKGTITHSILASHDEDKANGEMLRLRFDALASHDITYVGIIQTAKVSGLKTFPVPYILTNCHNSLCAVGGTINEDDHAFGFSAARKYGGIYVPPHLAVIHSYMKEEWAGCGKMILGSDSHTRYGALGTLGVGEGGGELVKQLLSQPYETAYPKVIGVYLEGTPAPWVGPMDIALALIGAVYSRNFAKNAVLEFTGPGIASLSAEFRSGIDVMTTETAAWSSIWQTDEIIRNYLVLHGRSGEYRKLAPAAIACYDGMIKIKLDKIKPMIALPFHPSNVYELGELINNPGDILGQLEKTTDLGLSDKIDSAGKIHVDQGIIAGCAGGTFENIMTTAEILNSPNAAAVEANSEFSLSVYPGSQPVFLELARSGALSKLAVSGAVVKTAFCGPCFGAGDVPANRSLSVRHTTRNFPNREGSKPKDGQIASVALMDARSIAATAKNGGILCSAETVMKKSESYDYHYDNAPYKARVYNGIGRAENGVELRYGPNITDWPPMEALGENILLKIVSFITDPVTTTDELIPSGETSSYRSNPLALAEFTLSRKDPLYVERAKEVRDRKNQKELELVQNACTQLSAGTPEAKTAPVQIASAIFAVKPGDGSAREQAASCQRVLGGLANFANEYATKRYRSNLINWGIIPFIVDSEKKPPFENGDYIFIPAIKKIIQEEKKAGAYIFRYVSGAVENRGTFTVSIPGLNQNEQELLLTGSLINYNRRRVENNG